MMGMQGMAALLTAYVLVAVVGLAVLAAFAVSGSTGRKADRGRLTEQLEDISSPQPLRPPPGIYPPEVPVGHPAVLPPNDRPSAPPPPVTPQPPLPPPPVAPAPGPQATASNAELRRWATDSGLRVANRGPIPAHVREAWVKANL